MGRGWGFNTTSHQDEMPSSDSVEDLSPSTLVRELQNEGGGRGFVAKSQIFTLTSVDNMVASLELVKELEQAAHKNQDY